VLTSALLDLVEREASAFSERFPQVTRLRVRLFDTNGPRRGLVKCCLAEATLSARRKSVIATDMDCDLYRAITSAFTKLERGTQTALGRQNRASRATVRGGSVAIQNASES
jgi:ribosome-associated translation inhibitor RaiA